MQIAVFTKNRINPAYGAARLGAEQTAARLGVQVTHYVPQVADDADEQIALVRRAIAQRVDAIALAAVHPTRLNAAVGEINAARIPLVGFISRTTEGVWDSFVGSDDCALGAALASYLFARMCGRGTSRSSKPPRIRPPASTARAASARRLPHIRAYALPAVVTGPISSRRRACRWRNYSNAHHASTPCSRPSPVWIPRGRLVYRTPTTSTDEVRL